MAAAASPGLWADAPFASDAGGGGASAEEAGEEAVTGGGVTLRLPLAMFADVDALSDVLSFDTWRHALSEDERDELRRLLPPGVHEGPGQELEDLLSGANVCFGNPLALAWDAMRSGLAHPRVARYEAGLRLLRRTAHTHTLRAHHDALVRRLAQARDVFAAAPPGATLSERLALLAAARGIAPAGSGGGGGDGGGAQGAAPPGAAAAKAAAARKRPRLAAPLPPAGALADAAQRAAYAAAATSAVALSRGGGGGGAAAARRAPQQRGGGAKAASATVTPAPPASAVLFPGLLDALRLALCAPGGPPADLGGLVAAVRGRAERARTLTKREVGAAVEAALRFLSREGHPPGPLVARAGGDAFAWVGPPVDAPLRWWRDDLHGTCASRDDAAALADAEARLAAFVAAEHAGAAAADDVVPAQQEEPGQREAMQAEAQQPGAEEGA